MIEEDVDYREISREEAIKLWPANRLTPHNAKFYQVTGECFKMIGMLKNKDIMTFVTSFLSFYVRALVCVSHPPKLLSCHH